MSYFNTPISLVMWFINKFNFLRELYVSSTLSTSIINEVLSIELEFNDHSSVPIIVRF